MKKQLLAIAAALGTITLGANAQAVMVAGWDFSQYLGDGTYVVDDGSLFEFVDTLGANYSSLDPSGLGPDSAVYGTMYVNGQFGSTAQPVGSGGETFLPSASVGGSLASNLTAPVTDGFTNPFDSHTSLQFEGQLNAQSLAMIALGSSSVVFSATPTLPGTDWIVSFGGRSFSGTSSVEVEFSTNGIDYASAGVIPLSAIDTPFSVALGAVLAQTAFVRFTFAVDGPAAPLIDNVAISATLVPEPGTALLLAIGVAGLARQGRRRA
jgi:hypothetical protein